MYISKPIFILGLILAAGLYFSLALAQEAPPAETPAPPTEAAPPAEAPAETPTDVETEAPTPPPAPEVIEAVNQDVDINPEDLGIKDQKLLPDSPLYFVKNIVRGVQSLITIDPVKDAELKLKFANEKIIEAKNLAEKTDKPDILEKGLENYNKELDVVKGQVDKIKDTAADNPKVDAFVEKFIDHNLKQQKLMDKLEEKMPEEVFDKVQEVKEKISEKFADVALKVATPEEIKDKLIKITEEQTGSDFKQFKNLEVLKRIEEKAPEQAKDAIRLAQENSFKRLQETLEQKEETQKMFKDYVGNVAGNEARQLEIVANFEAKMIPPQIRGVMEEAKIEASKRLQQRIMGFKEEGNKDRFLKHLEGGKIEDLRIIRELETNLPPDVVSKLLTMKEKAMSNFQKDIAETDTPEKQMAFFKKMEEFHDVKQMAMLKEMDAIIPEDKKDFWEQMKNKAKTEMEDSFSRAAGEMEKRMVIEQMAGGENPEDMMIIKEFGPPPEIMNEILKEQAGRLAERVQTTEDAEKLQILKQRIEEEEGIKTELRNRNPEIFRNLEKKEEMFERRMDESRAQEQINKAKAEIALAEQELSQADQNFIQQTPANVLLKSAKKGLEQAEQALGQNKIGLAFGQATAALHKANNVRRILKEVGLRAGIQQKRMEEMMGKPEEGMMPSSMPGEIPEEMKKMMPTDETKPEGTFEMMKKFMPQFPSVPSTGEQPPSEGIVCTQEYNPVCGSDEKTYSNECAAKAAGATVISSGSCQTTEKSSQIPSYSGLISTTPENCICPYAKYKPVCGSDNKTYLDECTAKCNSVNVAAEGFCK